MTPEMIARAWKDKDFRAQLNALQLNALPENPAGNAELRVQDIEEEPCWTSPVCTFYGPRCVV